MKISYKSILGGFAISLGVILSNLIDNEFISPLIFSVGILLCMDLKMHLITRAIPLKPYIPTCGNILLFNLLSAMACGLVVKFTFMHTVPRLNPDFIGAILTGIIIGIIAVINKKNMNGTYKIIITMLLMFAFVYLKLPHCVVYAFWFGCMECSFINLLIAVAGNIVGGLIIFLICYTKRRFFDAKC